MSFAVCLTAFFMNSPTEIGVNVPPFSGFPPPLCICGGGTLLSWQSIYFRKSVPGPECGCISEPASDTGCGTEMECPGLHQTGRCHLQRLWPHLCTWKSGPGRWTCQVVELNHRGRAIPVLHSAQNLLLQSLPPLSSRVAQAPGPPRLGVARGVAKDAWAGSGQGRGGTSAGLPGAGPGQERGGAGRGGGPARLPRHGP